MKREELELGDLGRHVVTGFEGVVIAKVDYLQGCRQLCLQPRGLHKETGQPLESVYFDEPYVDPVERAVVPVRQEGYLGGEAEVLPLRRQEGATKSPGKSHGTPTPRT